jgi:hypothetical protein
MMVMVMMVIMMVVRMMIVMMMMVVMVMIMMVMMMFTSEDYKEGITKSNYTINAGQPSIKRVNIHLLV